MVVLSFFFRPFFLFFPHTYWHTMSYRRDERIKPLAHYSFVDFVLYAQAMLDIISSKFFSFHWVRVMHVPHRKWEKRYYSFLCKLKSMTDLISIRAMMSFLFFLFFFLHYWAIFNQLYGWCKWFFVSGNTNFNWNCMHRMKLWEWKWGKEWMRSTYQTARVQIRWCCRVF